MKTITLGLSILLVSSTPGCGLSLIAERDTNPVVQDWASPWFSNTAEVFATKASHRMFMIQKQKDDKGNTKLITCAEPSPDVAEAFTSAIASAIKASGSDPNSGITAELAGQYARSVATQIAPLVYRTQGLQLYRDGLNSLCVDHMNGWITNTDYSTKKTDLLTEAVKLITEEKDLMIQAQKSFFENVKAGDTKINIGDITKISDALKSTNTTTTTSTNNATTTTTSTNDTKKTEPEQ